VSGRVLALWHWQSSAYPLRAGHIHNPAFSYCNIRGGPPPCSTVINWRFIGRPPRHSCRTGPRPGTLLQRLANAILLVSSGLALGKSTLLPTPVRWTPGHPTWAVIGNGLIKSIRANTSAGGAGDCNGLLGVPSTRRATPGSPRTLPPRNRIIKRLEPGVLVLEARFQRWAAADYRLGWLQSKAAMCFAIPGSVGTAAVARGLSPADSAGCLTLVESVGRHPAKELGAGGVNRQHRVPQACKRCHRRSWTARESPVLEALGSMIHNQRDVLGF